MEPLPRGRRSSFYLYQLERFGYYYTLTTFNTTLIVKIGVKKKIIALKGFLLHKSSTWPCKGQLCRYQYLVFRFIFYV